MTEAVPQTIDIRNSRDLLNKLEREFQRTQSATDRREVADHASNFIFTAWHLCDWAARDVERQADLPESAETPPNRAKALPRSLPGLRTLVMKKCPSLRICEAFCNATKHGDARNPVPGAQAIFFRLRSDEWDGASGQMVPKERRWHLTLYDGEHAYPVDQFFAGILDFWTHFVIGHDLGRLD